MQEALGKEAAFAAAASLSEISGWWVYSFFKEEEYSPQASVGRAVVSCSVRYGLMEHIGGLVGCGLLAGSPGSLS